MDVSPWNFRSILSVSFVCLMTITACGNRFDLSTERGRRARIDDANFHLSKGECSAALEAISHLYNSPAVNDEIRIITASAHACSGTFNLLTVVSNLSGATNFFSALVKSLSNVAGDGGPAAFYRATDVLSRNGTLLDAAQRSLSVNNYMVFIQMGVIGSILRNYGTPGTDGSQGAQLVYDTAGSPAGEMSNEDACALSAAFSILVDSHSRSSLSDSDTTALTTSLNSVCTAAGLASCTDISRNRSGCDGVNPQSDTAEQVVSSVNASW